MRYDFVAAIKAVWSFITEFTGSIFDGLIALITALSLLSWPLGIVVLCFVFKAQIREAVKALVSKVENALEIKFGDIQIKGPDVSSPVELKEASVNVKKRDKEWLEKRDLLYFKQRNIFLVHSVKPALGLHPTAKVPYFDISVYLASHKGRGALNDVKQVEYYLGEHFLDDTSKCPASFLVRNGTDGFPLKTDAYGPTLCQARIFFQDGTTIDVERYLDFVGYPYKYNAAVDAAEAANRLV
jgi:hypothetical protein